MCVGEWYPRMKDERVVLFIDGSNVFHTSSLFGENFRVNYLKLRDKLVGDRSLVRPYFFSAKGVPPPQRQVKFFDKLRYEGFEVVTRPLKFKAGVPVEKGVDVALATCMLILLMHDAYDTAIIVSGDNDYVDAVKEVKHTGRRVEVAAFKVAIGGDLRRIADSFTALDDIAEEIKLGE